VHVTLMHQVVVAQQANARVGTAATKTRAAVAGTTKKIYKQKGTGRARHGSRKVPLWTGGGVAHGPHPRSYEQHTPKKMRRAAMRSALSAKARDNQIVLLDAVELDRPRTKDMVALLGNLPVNGKVLLTLDAANENVALSARNLPNVHTAPALALSTLDVLNHDYLVATVPAIRQVEQWLGDGKVEPAPPAEPRPRRTTAAAAAATEAPAPTRRRAAPKADAPVEPEAPAPEKPARRRAAAAASDQPAEKPDAEAPAPRRRAAKAAPSADAESSTPPKRASRARKDTE
jgi:large subunit ribosomal protein L4